MTDTTQKAVERPLVEHTKTKPDEPPKDEIVVAKGLLPGLGGRKVPDVRVFKDGVRKAVYDQAEKAEKLQQLQKAEGGEGLAKTGTGLFDGKLIPEMDPASTRLLRECSTYHARCILAKANALVGFGHKKRNVHKQMNALMAPGKTWGQVLNEIAQDYFEHGRAYLEVVFSDGAITRVNYRRVADVSIVVESDQEVEDGVAAEEKFWYSVSVDGSDGDIYLRPYECPDLVIDDVGGTLVTNIRLLELRLPSTKNNFLSYPDWEPAIQQLELSDVTNEHFYSWFYNRAVPALAVLVSGNVSQESINALRDAFEGVQNPEDAWKTVVAGIPGVDTEVLVKELSASEGQEQVLQTTVASLAEMIVSAHGVPPLLAGIQIPGKMAATNELPNVITQFQIMEIASHQVYFSERFGMTFGADISGLTEEDFCPEPDNNTVGMDRLEPGDPLPQVDCNGFVTMMDRMNVVMMQATARMRDPATSPGRDASEGPARNGRDGNTQRGTNTSRGT